jgi:uncharacterized paraquat-inducible protein A
VSKIQLTIDFEQLKAPRRKGKTQFVTCLKCDIPIDLAQQEVRELKACPHCSDREWLLDLTVSQASFMYDLPPKAMGGRLKKKK